MTSFYFKETQVRNLINIAFGEKRCCSNVLPNTTNILRICEHLLCRKLQLACNDEGKETDPVESAKILFGLGRIYRLRSPNKVALIKSAVLYNAALARQANDKEVERDLNELCTHVLSRAGSVSSGEVLMNQAKNISNKIRALRETVKQKMLDLNNGFDHIIQKNAKELKRIKVVEEIQEIVHKKYVELMQNLMDWCESLLPTHLPKYALVARGRLARKDVIPYSVFFPALVLEDEIQQQSSYAKIREQIKWLWTIFEIVIANVGEIVISDDILPFLRFPVDGEVATFIDVYGFMGICTESVLQSRVHYNKYTPRISDLILPISEMLSFLEDKQNIMLSYGCSDVSNMICFVSGSRVVYEELQRRISEKNKQLLSSTELCQRVQEMTRKSLPNISSPVTTASPWDYQVTEIVHTNLTVYVTALGNCHQITDRSTFNIIRKLREQQHINYSFAHDLLHAVAVSYQVRLEVALSEGKLNNWSENGCVENGLIVTFDKILGQRDCLHYMMTVQEMQRKIARFLDSSNVSIVEKSSVLDKLVSYFWLHQTKAAIGEVEHLQNEGLLDSEAKQVVIPILMEFGTDCLMDEKNTEALKIFQFAQSVFDDDLSRDFPEKLIECVHMHGVCLHAFSDFNEDHRIFPEASAELKIACRLFEQELKMRIEISSNKRKDIGIASCYWILGNTCFRLRELVQGVEYFGKAENIYELFKEPRYQLRLSDCLRGSGMCFAFMQKDSKALHQFLQELTLRIKYTPYPDSDSLLAACYYNIAYCYFKRYDYEKALKNFEIAQPILVKADLAIQERRVWKTPLMKGRCLAVLGRHENAIPEFQEALRLCKEFSKNPTQQQDIAMCLYHLGNSLFDLLETEEALDVFVQAKHMFCNLDRCGGSFQKDIMDCEKMEKWCHERLRRFSFQHPVRIPSLNRFRCQSFPTRIDAV